MRGNATLPGKRESRGLHTLLLHGEEHCCEMLPTATVLAQVTHKRMLQPALLCRACREAAIEGKRQRAGLPFVFWTLPENLA